MPKEKLALPKMNKKKKALTNNTKLIAEFSKLTKERLALLKMTKEIKAFPNMTK